MERSVQYPWVEPTGTSVLGGPASAMWSWESVPSHVLQQLPAGLLAPTPAPLQVILHSPQGSPSEPCKHGSVDQLQQHHLEAVRNAESQAPPYAYWTRVSSLTSSSGDSNVSDEILQWLSVTLGGNLTCPGDLPHPPLRPGIQVPTLTVLHTHQPSFCSSGPPSPSLSQGLGTGCSLWPSTPRPSYGLLLNSFVPSWEWPHLVTLYHESPSLTLSPIILNHIILFSFL